MFVAALSEFDQMLAEDSRKNRMAEALELFGAICGNEWFANTSIILFLNKQDLFAAKIKQGGGGIAKVPDFADYDGEPEDFDASVRYFIELFLDLNANPDKSVYYHITCATDTSNIKFVMKVSSVRAACSSLYFLGGWICPFGVDLLIFFSLALFRRCSPLRFYYFYSHFNNSDRRCRT